MLTCKGMVVNDNQLFCRASKYDRNACNLKTALLPKESGPEGARSIYEGARDMARDIATIDAAPRAGLAELGYAAPACGAPRRLSPGEQPTPPPPRSLFPPPLRHSRTKTPPVLQTLMLPRVTAEYQAGKLATTETRQPFTWGSLRVTLVFGASGPERATAFAPTSTATAVAGTTRPFTTISLAAERRLCGRAAEETSGAGAVDAGGAEVGAPAGSGAGAVSAELAGDVFGAATGGVGAAGSSTVGKGAAGGAVGSASSDWEGVISGPTSDCASAALDPIALAITSAKSRTIRPLQSCCIARSI